MKLIDLLVKELPKRGGWPEGVVKIHQDYNGETWGWLVHDSAELLFTLDQVATNARKYGKKEKCENMVTREQYKSALALSQKPAWNGEGMPPVSEKVEFFINPKLGYRNDWIPAAGTEMEVVAHKTTTDGNDVAVCYWDEGGAGRSCCFVPESLKPLGTEAERKRDAFINAVLDDMRTIPCDLSLRDEVAVIYDAIAAGKIPGVKLDD